MGKLTYTILLLFITHVLFSQDIRVYHGGKSESVYLKQNDRLDNLSRETVKIARGKDGIVSISIVNPNPFFYTYEIKTEDVEIEDEYTDQFAELVELITAIPDVSDNFKKAGARLGPIEDNFDKYKKALENLGKQIDEAKRIIKTSDNPETVREAFRREINTSGFGFRAAIDKLQKLPAIEANFNSPTLEKDLNKLLDATIGDPSFDTRMGLGSNASLLEMFKQAFQNLNKSLASTITQFVDLTKKDRIVRFQIPVKENKKTTVRLIVKKKDDNASVTRELIDEEIAVIMPFYERKTFQVVPVLNLVFQSNHQKFVVEEGVVKSITDDDAKFNVGAMALMNFTSFGLYKEWGVGIGIGYSIQPGGKAGSFFAIPSLSYRDVVRIGFGFGYNLAPAGLKNGAKVDMPLPENITDIENVVDYKRKPAAVFTIAIAGLKF